MADNYLENRMEEHRLGRDGSRRIASARRSPLSYVLPPRKIFVTGEITPFLVSLLTVLAEDGMNIAVMPSRQCLCQAECLRDKTGVRVYPVLPDLRQVAFDWRGINILIINGEDEYGVESGLKALVPDTVCNIPQDMPVMILRSDESGMTVESRYLLHESTAAGQIEIISGYALSAAVKFVKWILSPENSVLTGSRFKIRLKE